MNFFQRIAALLKANLNDLISRAEEPEKVLTQAIEDLRKQLIEAKSRVALAIADEKRLEKQLETESAKVKDWEQKAMASVRASRDDLAVQALAKKKEHEAVALQIEQQHKDQRAAVEELKKALAALSAKIDEAGRKRAVMVARVKRAEAQKAIADTLSAANDRSAFETFDRMSDKVDRIEAEAGARMEVASLTSGSHDHDLAEKIKLLEAAPVDDELLALKQKMGLLGPGTRGALGPGEDEAADASEETPLSRQRS
ncbi:MAG: PspA/IM30 family protein [Deltaproteobacteria bacterium]|nr:PspA/IM30 family protein [Deltaproteobacteria bacterium]